MPPFFASGSRKGITLRGLVAELASRGLKVDCRTVWSFVHREGLSFKKTVLPSEQDRADIARKRARWKAYQGQIDPRRLVFIDETWAKTTMAPLRGWGLRGKRLKAKAPYGHWKTMTFRAALRHDRIDAPWVVDGSINGELFRLYVEKVLVPTLKKGDIVILDNLGSQSLLTKRMPSLPRKRRIWCYVNASRSRIPTASGHHCDEKPCGHSQDGSHRACSHARRKHSLP